jgi:hypothetical protein
MNTKSCCVVILAVCAAVAQTMASRQLWNTEFLKNRPAGKQASPPARVNYRPVGPVKPSSAPAGSQTMLGVTLWRLRVPQPKETAGARLLVIEKTGEQRDLIPERVEANTELSEGDHVRLTVEVPGNGYLYVIDREQFSDGTTGAPYLIYPNQLTRPGDNAVSAGRLIEIPDRRDEPNCFTVRASRPGQTAELLSLVVTPEPLTGLKIGNEPLLVDKLYAEWEKKWGVQAQRFELDGSAGKAWTEKEKQAGGAAGATLTQDDELPQTLYRVNAKLGSPMVMQLALRIKP